MILAALYLLIAMAASVAVTKLGLRHAAAACAVVAAFWFESSLLVCRVYNVILPLPSFALLLLGAYAVGLLALIWDFDDESANKSAE